MFLAAAAVEPGTKYGNDLQYVISQFLFKRRLVAFVNDHNLNALYVTERKNQLGSEPEQPVLVGLFLNKSQPSDLALHDQFKKLVQPFLPVIHARTQVTNDLGSPAFGGTVCFQ